MSHQDKLTDYVAAFVSELVKSNILDVVVSPGSRSTPMALLLAEHPKLKLHVHVDERSAGFFALGIAKASKRPTVLLCTSGTAAANYFPAIIEANLSRVPLIVITADRPHELRDVGAPQAINQIDLYGKHVKWFVEMSPPDNSDEMIRYARTVCARAVAVAKGSPEGPVHINMPFREPLLPNLNKENLFEMKERNNGFIKIQKGDNVLDEQTIKYVAETLNAVQKGIIVCGPIDHPAFCQSVVKLAEKLKYPILADPLSQLRSGNRNVDYIIDTYDTFLREDLAKEKLKPEVIIRFGAMPISKALTIFLKENHDARQLVIDNGQGFRDPALLSTDMYYCEEHSFCTSLVEQLTNHSETTYIDKWKDINLITKSMLSRINDSTELSEGKLFSLLQDVLPKDSTLFVGNSMPIRDLDTFFHLNDNSIKIMANRGANGIDGIISTALGVGTINQPLILVLGDLTFFHDLNGLIVSKLYDISITIILINNNGGGIFSFLPQSSVPNHFDLLFGTPLNLDFRHIIEMYDGHYELIQNWDQFSTAFTKNKGLNVFEIRTNRDNNVAEHRKLWNDVSQEIRNKFIGE